MDITSFVYIIFVGISLIAYWNFPKGYQWVVLLVDSLIFYFLNAEWYTFIYLIISVMTVWAATNYFIKCNVGKNKKSVLVATIIVNIGMLAVLKYTNMAINTLNILCEHISGYRIQNVSWVSSLAISFYTLQIVSYLLDAYWGVTNVEQNPIKLLLFTCYFPLMVSGPINRHEEFSHQLFEEHRFDYASVTHGMKRMAWGLVKKLAIANRLSIIVDNLWDNPEIYSGLWIWVAVIVYVFQLYTDFSGCMDIVIGVSECFGIKLAENFNAPLLSKNIQEFWQRWHITLGQWLRDYIMNPLLKSEPMIRLGDRAKKRFGKKNGKKIPSYIAMLGVWLAMGLWHGNSWKYIVGEGLWFWFVIVAGQVLSPTFDKCKGDLKIKVGGVFWKLWQILRTDLIYAFGMLFFRADSLKDSMFRLRLSIGINVNMTMIKTVISNVISPLGKEGAILLVVSMTMLVIYDIYLYMGVELIDKISGKCFAFRWLLYVALVLIVCCSYNMAGTSFEYAQF